MSDTFISADKTLGPQYSETTKHDIAKLAVDMGILSNCRSTVAVQSSTATSQQPQNQTVVVSYQTTPEITAIREWIEYWRNPIRVTEQHHLQPNNNNNTQKSKKKH